jgi:hypothetical protein
MGKREREEGEPRTLRDMIDATLQRRKERKGLRCPKCGCPDLQVRVTWKGEGKVKRRRVCANCGRELATFEAPA